MSGQLCLSWNNHNVAFNKMLKGIYMQKQNSDGTILCHGNFYPVHRFVLTTCSEYFEELFKQCEELNHKHAFIIVKDINSEQMEALLTYMYKGEVNVLQQSLPELIKAAEALKIRGLAVPDGVSLAIPSKKRPNTNNVSIGNSPPVKKIRRDLSTIPVLNTRETDLNKSEFSEDTIVGTTGYNGISLNKNETNSSVSFAEDTPVTIEIKTEQMDAPISIVKDEVLSISESEYLNFESIFIQNSESLSDDNEDVRKQLKDDLCITSPKKMTCSYPSCTYATDCPSAAKKHYRKHTGEKPFECELCPFRTAQMSNMTTHMKGIHLKERPFVCEHCPYRAAQKINLITHMLKNHVDTIEEL